jgi:hypothetical protein
MTMTSDEHIEKVKAQIIEDIRAAFLEMRLETERMGQELRKLVDDAFERRIADLNRAVSRLAAPPRQTWH